MKRQSSTRSRKGNSPENINTLHSNSIGCMSGLFRLLSNYPRRRKSITFGKKQDGSVNVKPSDSEAVVLAGKAEYTPLSPQIREGGIGNEKQSPAKGLSSNVPRSPTLPAEIRSPPPGLVARLMGLQDDLSSCCSLTPESAAEKRRLLLAALEKCDQDLKTLKRIIEVVTISVGGGADNKDGGSSLLSSVPAPAVDGYSSKRCTDGRSWRQQPQRRPGEEGMAAASRFTERIKFGAESIYDAPKRLSPERPTVANKAMEESVEQVCRDIVWGERREVGRIGLALQDYICRDLIEEIVKDMGCRFNAAFTSLPLEACKRRLSF